MNRKFVKIVAIILAALMVISVGYVLIAVVAGSLSASAATTAAVAVTAKAAPLLLAA